MTHTNKTQNLFRDGVSLYRVNLAIDLNNRRGRVILTSLGRKEGKKGKTLTVEEII